jgi:hypothetical protein
LLGTKERIGTSVYGKKVSINVINERRFREITIRKNGQRERQMGLAKVGRMFWGNAQNTRRLFV